MQSKKFFKLITWVGILAIGSLGTMVLSYKSNNKAIKTVAKKNFSNKSNDYIASKKYQLKIFLNYSSPNFDQIEDEVNYFGKKNQQYAQELMTRLKNVTSFEISHLMPIVWLNFDNLKAYEANIKSLQKIDFVIGATLNEYKVQNAAKADLNNNKISFSDNSLVDKLNLINFTKRRKWENKSQLALNWDKSKSNSKIGILEVGDAVLNTDLDLFKDRDIEIYQDQQTKANKHATIVAAAAAGRSGVDRFAKIYAAGFGQYGISDWQKKIEWMIINGVKIINHSYGSREDLDNVEYGKDSYFLDYITRKYGIINVFAAGNGHKKPDSKNEWIDGAQLALNSITVGATDLYKNHYNPAEFSNRTRFGKWLDLPKPLIAAPGYDFKIKFKNKEVSYDGTSFATPIVTGAISVLLKKAKHLNTDEKRVVAIKAILAASGRESDQSFFENEINKNGLNNAVGAGLLDFERMKKAAKNITIKTIGAKNKQENVLIKKVNLKAKQKIQIGLAWLFNAGVLETPDPKPDKNLSNYNELLKQYWNQHVRTDILKLKETVKKQNNQFFSNYDLYFEWKNPTTKQWQVVKKVDVINSNVEVVRYTSPHGGQYRIVVKKVRSALFPNSVPDKLAVSFVKSK
ncbi:S8 family serine peptidase [Candidatus Mycoplasma pogonae]